MSGVVYLPKIPTSWGGFHCGKYVVFSGLAQTIHFSYPSHRIKKMRDFCNPLANLLRSVEFSYLSPVS